MEKIDNNELTFFVINIKLITSTEISTQRYFDLVENLFKKAPITRTGKDAVGILKGYSIGKSTAGNYFDGEVIKAKVLEDIYTFDENDQLVKEEGTQPKYSDIKAARFIFIPNAHRFAFIPNENITIQWFEGFLKKAIKAIIAENEKIEIIVKTSNEFLEKYLSSDTIRKIKIKTSYSNSDSFDKIAMRTIDENMKKTHTRTIKIEAQSDETGGIDLVNNKILNPLAGQALDNGEIFAWSKDNQTTIADITTKETPQEYSIQASSPSEEGLEIFRKIMSIFRPES